MPLAPDDQLQVMHILQEAVSNVRKHAQATRVEVELKRGPDYAFTVRDDGSGFDPARTQDDAAGHVGLRIMRERAARIGGTVTVQSRPGEGTTVVLHVPFARREPDASAARVSRRRRKTGSHERAGPPQARIAPPRRDGAQRQGRPQ